MPSTVPAARRHAEVTTRDLPLIGENPGAQRFGPDTRSAFELAMERKHDRERALRGRAA